MVKNMKAIWPISHWRWSTSDSSISGGWPELLGW